MKHINLFFAAVVIVGTVSAQSIKLSTGKKFTVTTDMQINSTVTAMGQEMEVASNNITGIDFEVKNVTGTGYTLTSTMKHLKVNVKVMGQDQTIDSDDPGSRDNPAAGEVFKSLNKSSEFQVDNGNVNVSGELSSVMSNAGLPSSTNEMAKYILTKEMDAKLKTGYAWTDSVKVDQITQVNEYKVQESSDAAAVVLVKSTVKASITQTQMGMEAKVTMNGMVNAKRYYNRTTGLLQKEEADMIAEGTTEVMGQSMPMKIKQNITTTVKD